MNFTINQSGGIQSQEIQISFLLYFHMCWLRNLPKISEMLLLSVTEIGMMNFKSDLVPQKGDNDIPPESQRILHAETRRSLGKYSLGDRHFL